MKNLKLYEEWLSEKKPAGAPEWKDSDAPDAEGRFKELGIKDLAAWLIKTRKKDLKKISGSITQQIVFNRKKDPEYAEKMEKVRQEVYKQLGREDLMESIKDGVIKCDNCDWKWDIVTGGDDPYDCHKCGHSNEPLSEKEDLYEAKIGVADPSIDVSQIVYGNAPKELHEVAYRPNDPLKERFLEQGWVEKIRNEAPQNDSETTQNDLKSLVKLTENATAEEILFARYVDDVSNMAQSFIDILSEGGHEVSMGDFFRIDTQTEGLLFFLKDIINRPRPYQLAKTFNYPLYPLMQTNAMTAAYPSGHALTAFVMGEYYAKKYPNVAKKTRDLGARIAKSRELTGIHYPSDTQASKMICDLIFANNLIVDK
jgi:hypothetical protein